MTAINKQKGKRDMNDARQAELEKRIAEKLRQADRALLARRIRETRAEANALIRRAERLEAEMAALNGEDQE